ncbi:unnamed protein product [marine sediment metagenome]|uniref:Uncharacterized protein n=1 Tax=marine sediment metagenome TaxID=412755 RepID=X0Z9L3_9ZZZZ
MAKIRVDDLYRWKKQGLGKMTKEQIIDNVTYVRTIISRLKTGSPQINFHIYSDKDADETENYIKRNINIDEMISLLRQLKLK